ncbi:hypothetical protein LJC64_03290 [Ruminococcaceae bacterium OttesenSCG-928-A11]|nr:hypothetical protein [Ruminococcaceae bacterium OttesenSCG-928-A11]
MNEQSQLNEQQNPVSSDWNRVSDSTSNPQKEKEIVNQQLDYYIKAIQSLEAQIRDELDKSPNGSDKIRTLETQKSDYEYLASEVANALAVLPLPKNYGKTVDDILKEESELKQSQIGEWQEANQFPDDWEVVKRQKDLLDIAAQGTENIRASIKS